MFNKVNRVVPPIKYILYCCSNETDLKRKLDSLTKKD